MSPAERQRLAAVESELATLKRQTTPTHGMGAGVSTANGAINVRTTQIGFPAELTGTYESTGSRNGYPWKQLDLSTTATVGLVNPSIQLTGDKAFDVAGGTKLTAGTRVWMEPAPQSNGFIFHVASSGNPPLSPCGGCGFFAGATEYDCWTLTVVGASGNMDSLNLTQTLTLTWNAAGYWESTTDFTICGYTGKVRVIRGDDGEPELFLVAANYFLTLSCCDAASQTMYFSGGNSGETVLCCERETNDGPAANLFTLAVKWVHCPITPNPSYSTPGWYCIAATDCTGTRRCCYLTTDPGATVVVCSGPHANESTCLASCTAPATITVACCANPIPATLFASINGVIYTLTYGGSNFQWETTVTLCGHSCHLWLNCEHIANTNPPQYQWKLDVSANDAACAGSVIIPTDAAYCSPFGVVFTGLTILACCGTSFTVVITE